jgi:signal transduction histidine kinase
VAELFVPQAGSKGIQLRLHLPDSPVLLVTDETKLRQILINVVGNAMKFTERGVVDICLQKSADRVTFVMKDTGPGIIAADLERIFDPFTQLDQSLTRSKGGTGLGLPVSRKLAHLLDGDLIVDSVPGEGTTFTLWLPLTAPSEVAPVSSVLGIALPS